MPLEAGPEATYYENLIVQRLEGGVGLMRINRPKRRNALNQATLQELAHAARAFDLDPEIGCLVITGDERAFAAGADVTEMDGKGVPDMLGAYRFESWEALTRTRKPVIAAVSGYALGGGLELALLCDMIVVSESAQLGQPEINLGIMPGAGGTQRLTRQLGKYLAMEVILAGRRVNDGMAQHVADQTVKLMLRKGLPVLGSKVLVLGLTFKENCPDLRNTKVIDIVNGLRRYNAVVDVYDPWIDVAEARREYQLDCLPVLPTTPQYAAIVVAVGHRQFLDMGEAGIRNLGLPGAVVFDVKGILPSDAVDARL